MTVIQLLQSENFSKLQVKYLNFIDVFSTAAS